MTTKEQLRLVIGAREEERRRIARRWLDGPAQTLANLALHAEICARLLDRAPDETQRELQNLRARLGEALQATRLFLYDVFPPGLEDADIMATLRRYLGVLQDTRGIATDLTDSGSPVDLDRELTINLFRALQESIDVAAGRTGTTRIAVALDWQPGTLVVTIEDDGRAVVRRTPGPQRPVDGQDDAQARLTLVGGRLVVEPLGPTIRVRVEMPLPSV